MVTKEEGGRGGIVTQLLLIFLLVINSLLLWGFVLFCFCLRKSFFNPSLLESNFAGYRILGWCFVLFFSQHFKYFTPLSSCLHGFWQEVYSKFYPCCSRDNVFFFPKIIFRLSFLFFVFVVFLKIYLFLAALGLCCCMWAFFSCGAWASHCCGFSVAEHGL